MRPTLVLALAPFAFGCGGGPVDDVDDTDDGPAAPCADDAYADVPNVACSGTVARISGTLTEDLVLVPGLEWLLVGGVFVGDPGDGLTLTIEPGTTVFGDSATDGFLVVQPGNRIVADGREDAPIVFTSAQEPGSRSRSDWGGLVINGYAPTNVCQSTEDCPVPGEAGTGTYGGTDPDDDSGVLRYVRVEFAGTLVNDAQEINGVALQGVGRGTVVDHLHAHLTADDGVEMFGGTVDLKHVIVTGAGDDGFDWTDGWTGRAQHVVVQHHPDQGDHGIEADNNKDAFDLLPRSEPRIRNVTLVKARPASGFTNGYGMLLRAGTAGHLGQVLVAGYEFGCANIDDGATFDVGVECDTSEPTGALEVVDSWFSCADTVRPGEPFPADDFDFDSDLTACDVDAFFRTGLDGNTVADAHHLRAPFDLTTPDFRPEDGAPLLGVEVDGEDDPWFDTTDHIGAFGTDNWAAWTEFPAN